MLRRADLPTGVAGVPCRHVDFRPERSPLLGQRKSRNPSILARGHTPIPEPARRFFAACIENCLAPVILQEAKTAGLREMLM